MNFKNTNISVAVAIEGGLITPIVKNVESKGLLEISQPVALELLAHRRLVHGPCHFHSIPSSRRRVLVEHSDCPVRCLSALNWSLGCRFRGTAREKSPDNDERASFVQHGVVVAAAVVKDAAE